MTNMATKSPSCVAATSSSPASCGSAQNPRVAVSANRMSMLQLHSPLGWKRPFARAASRLKRASSSSTGRHDTISSLSSSSSSKQNGGVGSLLLDDASSFSTSRTHSNSSRTRSRTSLDLLVSGSNRSDDTHSITNNSDYNSINSDCYYNQSPASTASPGTLKRKKQIRKRGEQQPPRGLSTILPPAAPDLSSLSAHSKQSSSVDEPKPLRRRHSSSKKTLSSTREEKEDDATLAPAPRRTKKKKDKGGGDAAASRKAKSKKKLLVVSKPQQEDDPSAAAAAAAAAGRTAKPSTSAIDDTHLVPLEETTSTAEKTVKPKTKKKKKKTLKKGDDGDTEAATSAKKTKKKTKKKKKATELSSCETIQEQATPPPTTTAADDEEMEDKSEPPLDLFPRSLHSLHSYGSFSLNSSGPTAAIYDDDLSIQSEADATRNTSIQSEIDAAFDLSQSARVMPCRAVPLHHRHRTSSLKPCLRTNKPSHHGAGGERQKQAPLTSSLDLLDYSTRSLPAMTRAWADRGNDFDDNSSEDEFMLPLSSSVKLGDFIERRSSSSSFDPFEGCNDHRQSISGGSSMDLDDIFGNVSLEGTRPTQRESSHSVVDRVFSGCLSRRSSYHGSSSSSRRPRSMSMSPGHLAGRRKALIGDWTAPVDASEHWSSSHERNSLDSMSIPDIRRNNSFHGNASSSSVVSSRVIRSNSSHHRRDADKSNNKGDCSSMCWSSSADGAGFPSGHSAGQEVSTCDEDTAEEFADDMFEIDAEDDDDFLSDDDLKGKNHDDDDDDNGNLQPCTGLNMAGQRGRNLRRAISDTSFDGPCSDDERAAFEDEDDDDDETVAPEQDHLGANSSHGNASADAASLALLPLTINDPKDEDSSCPFEVLQMTPRSKTRFMTKGGKLALMTMASPAPIAVAPTADTLVVED